jgi:methionine synthase / methylenetetrahydrofolate reductase(NADPH)
MESKSRAREFRDTIAGRSMIADGAMGTMLYAKGIFINRCFDELNLSAPAMVKEVHQEYVKAGAEILETNTFGANRIRLAAFGLAEKLKPINQAGVRLAREAAGTQAFVAGAMGPLGHRVEPFGPITFQEARSIFREQADALVEAGIDLLILETFGDMLELREAICAAREAGGDDMIIVAQVTINDDGSVRDGSIPETYTRQLNEWPVDIIGCNCSTGPRVTLETIEKMRPFSLKPLSAMPNAGHPSQVEGRNIYLCSPEYMAQYARRFLAAGIKIFGGCCGTTPEHIKLVRAEARSLRPGLSREHEPAGGPPAGVKSLSKIPLDKKSSLGEKLAAGKFISFVEILPPRGTDPAREVEGSRLCRAGGIDCINVPDGPRASARLSAQVTCQLIQQQAGIETVLHVCCRDRNILGIQSELLGAHAVGIRNLICITGDPPRMGTYPDATAVFDVDSIGLVRIASNLNRGLDIGGNPIGSQTALVIGVGANPGAVSLEDELKRLESKIKAGAEYIVTQPVFDIELLKRFLDLIQHHRTPVIAGIWPLTSYRNAEFLVNELRVPVPERFMARMQTVENAEDSRREGVEIAREMVRLVRPLVQGVQLSAPFGRYQMALDVAEAIGSR